MIKQIIKSKEDLTKAISNELENGNYDIDEEETKDIINEVLFLTKEAYPSLLVIDFVITTHTIAFTYASFSKEEVLNLEWE